MSEQQRTTMDFFGAQDVHHRNTAVLLIYFSIAVAVTATAAYLVAVVYWYVFNDVANFWRDWYDLSTVEFEWWNLQKYYFIAGPFALALIGLSVWKTRNLSAPIDLVMPLIGATEVDRSIKHPASLQYLSIVEEMSIASQTPMPRTYVIAKQYGINAMAVGWSSDDAAIAVSAGALQMLSRDEMQGVIAHEFSHILNGDMAMNVKLLGVLHGIDSIGIMGRLFVKFLIKSGQMGIPGHSNVIAMSSWVALILSLPFAALSYLGVAFGQLIRAAISRQREYLADASAVQFTRNPSGIAGALKKIGGLTAGSAMSNPSMLVTSHFFIASAFGSNPGMFTTDSHPPLPDRVKRIDPEFDGEFPYVPLHYEAHMGNVEDAQWVPGAGGDSLTPLPAITMDDGSTLTHDQLGAALRTPDPSYSSFARALLRDLPDEIVTASASESLALPLIVALTLSSADETRRQQLATLDKLHGESASEQAEALVHHLTGMDQAAEVPVIEKALESLADLDRPERERAYETFMKTFDPDKASSSHDYVFSAALGSRLASLSGVKKRSSLAVETLAELEKEVLTIVAYVVSWKHITEGGDEASQARLTALPVLAGIDFKKVDTSVPAIRNATERIGQANPAIKREILILITQILSPNGVMTAAEAEMAWLLAELIRARIPARMPGTIKKILKS